MDLYQILEVSVNASDQEIKVAYRKKAVTFHPDKNPDNVAYATEKFKEVQSAYDTLIDPQKRATYNATRPKTERKPRPKPKPPQPEVHPHNNLKKPNSNSHPHNDMVYDLDFKGLPEQTKSDFVDKFEKEYLDQDKLSVIMGRNIHKRYIRTQSNLIDP